MILKFSTLISLFLPLSLLAQVEQSLVTTPSFEPTEAENSLLWEISGKDLKEPSYLFGTIHLIPKEDFLLTDLTLEAFAKSKKVVFEVNTEDMFDLGTQFSLLMKSFMDGGTRLRDLLNKEDYQLVEDHFNKIGMPLLLLERVKPMILSVFASQDMSAGGFSGMGDVKSYEIELTEMAKKAQKPIDGLETIEFQMSMFDSIPYDAQAKMLVESIRTEGGADDQFSQMVELYKNQDLAGMQKMILSESDGIGSFDELLLNNRNKSWIEPMQQMMAVQPTFFAVGAGHLAGKSGVIPLLRAKGYTLKAIR